MLVCVALPACNSAPRVERPVFEGDTLEVTADADLLRPALLFACGRSGLAIMDETEQEDGTIVFELISLRDEPGTLTATPDGDGGWRIAATVGRFGDAEQEGALLAQLGDRIDRLQRAGQ